MNLARPISLARAFVLALVACGAPPPGGGDEVSEPIINCGPTNPDCPLYDGPRCPAVLSDPPPYNGSYICNASLADKYGRVLSGARVHLQSSWCNEFGTQQLGEVVGTIGTTGQLRLAGTLPRGNRVACWIDTTNAENTSAGVGRNTAFTSATLTVQAQRTPEPTLTRTIPGLVAGDATMDLYQSGAYDKVLVVVEHFDPDENDPLAHRDRTRFWNALSRLMQTQFTDGWDVWLFQPHSTGDNLHEQSAELAQAIQLAGRTFGGAPRCGGGEITVLGFNSGGLVARMATSRWEKDPAWTAALGISGPLPVNAVGTIDSPHYGWNLNRDFQSALWGSRGAEDIWAHTNLDSCAAAQLTRTRYDVRAGGFNNGAWQAFFQTGASFGVRTRGVDVTCAGGPAVANDLDWPSSVRLFGFANGSDGGVNKCYGTVDDLNGSGQNLCADIAAIGAPQSGADWMAITVSGGPDQHWTATLADVQPGSRNPMFLDRQTGWWSWGPLGGVYTYHQRFSPTFIPSISADGSDGPRPRTSPFAEFGYNSMNLASDVISAAAAVLITRNLNAAGVCP